VTRSVEIPDEAVHKAIIAAGQSMLHGDRVAQIRAALVAARPYLMPSREAVSVVLHRDNHILGSQECRQQHNGELISCHERTMHDAGRILDLLNGES
jgi:hypothetical protein